MSTATAPEAAKPTLKLADFKGKLDLPTVKLSRPTPAESVARTVKPEAATGTTPPPSDKDKLQKEIEERLNRVTHKKGEGLYAADIVRTGRHAQVTLHDYDDRDLLEVVSAYRRTLPALKNSKQISEGEFNYLNETIGVLEQRQEDIDYLREHKGILAPLRTVLQRAGHRLTGEEWRIFHNSNEVSIALVYLREVRWLADYAGRTGKSVSDVAVEFGMPGIVKEKELKKWFDLEKKIYKQLTGKGNVDTYLSTAVTAFDPTLNPAATAASPDTRGRTDDIIHNRIVARLDNLLKARGFANYAAVPTEELKLQLRLEAARLTIYEYLNGATDKIMEAYVHGAQGEYNLTDAFKTAEERWRDKTKKLTDVEKRTANDKKDEKQIEYDNAKKAREVLEAIRTKVLGEDPNNSLRKQITRKRKEATSAGNEITKMDYDGLMKGFQDKLDDLVKTYGVSNVSDADQKIKDLTTKRDAIDPKLPDADVQKKKFQDEIDALNKAKGPLDQYQQEIDKLKAAKLAAVRKQDQATIEADLLEEDLENYEKLYLGGIPADRDAFDYTKKFMEEVEKLRKAEVAAKHELEDATNVAAGQKTDQERKDDEERADAVTGHALFVLGPKGEEGKTFMAAMNKVKNGALLKQENGRSQNGPEEVRNLIWGTDAEVAKLIPTKNRRKLLSDVEYVIVAARHFRITDDAQLNGIITAAEALYQAEDRLRSHNEATYDASITPFADKKTQLEDALKAAGRAYATQVTTNLEAAVNRIKNEIAYGKSEPEHVGLMRAFVTHVTDKIKREQDPFTEVLVSSQEQQAKYS